MGKLMGKLRGTNPQKTYWLKCHKAENGPKLAELEMVVK
jgi:hypothetical protein